ncbi:MAG: hypothetical protein AAGG54_12955 [Pseudomonadota bacterium]
MQSAASVTVRSPQTVSASAIGLVSKPLRNQQISGLLASEGLRASLLARPPMFDIFQTVALIDFAGNLEAALAAIKLPRAIIQRVGPNSDPIAIFFRKIEQVFTNPLATRSFCQVETADIIILSRAKAHHVAI